MKIIKQPNTYSCIACVAAMIAGEELKDVIDFVGHDGSDFDSCTAHPFHYTGFYLEEIMLYLLDRGYSLGTFLILNSDFNDFETKDSINFIIKIQNPAMLTVKSKVFPEHTKHVVYWNGEHVLDPNPSISGVKKLNYYDILEWWPILRIV